MLFGENAYFVVRTSLHLEMQTWVRVDEGQHQARRVIGKRTGDGQSSYWSQAYHEFVTANLHGRARMLA